MAEETSKAFNHQFPAELRDRLDAYVAAETKRIAPGKLPMRAVINEALDEYLTRRGYKAPETQEAA